LSPPRLKKILVIDDEPDVVTYLAALLGDHGYQVSSALDAREGFAKAKTTRPDLITLDISMPNESGMRLLRDLQNDAETASIPVIIITGISSEFQRFIATRKHLRAPDAYFEKPIDRGELLAAIRRILEPPSP